MIMGTTRFLSTTKRWLAIALLAVFATACSSSAGSATTVSQPETTATEAPATTEQEVTDEEAATTQPEMAEAEQATAEPEATDAEEAIEEQPVEVPAGPVLLDGLDAITQVTPSSGQGTRPLLAWEPVAGAEFYSLALYAPDGQPYWGSLLIETETFVGGPIQIDEDKPGPRVITGMTWSVVGLDADMVPVASSPIRPIAP